MFLKRQGIIRLGPNDLVRSISYNINNESLCDLMLLDHVEHG